MQTSKSSTPNLLIVEDDEDTIVLLSDLFQAQGWFVRCEETGQAALKALAQESFDLLILDIMLPDMDGFEIARTIRRAEESGEHLPIIMLTAKIGLTDRVTGLEAGADDYVVKPFRTQELVARVRAHLRGKQIEDHLRIEAQQWLTVFESISDGAFILDEAGRILKANAGFCNLIGCSLPDLQDRQLASLGLVPADVEHQWLAQLQQPQHPPPTMTSQDILAVTCEGRRLWVQASFTPLPAEGEGSNGPTMGLGIWRNVTEQREMAETLRRQNRYLAALNAVAAAANSSLNLDEVLDNALDKLLDVLGLDVGEVHLWDEAARVLVLTTHRGVSAEYVRQAGRMALGQSLTGRVAQTGEPIFLSHSVATDPRVSLEGTQASGMEAIAIVPLRARGRLVGTLGVGSFQPHPFSDMDIDLLSAVVDQVGIAIEDARLYQQTDASLHQRIAELTVLNKIGQTVSSILDLDRLLEVTMQLIKDITHVEAGSLILVDEDTEELVFKVVLQTKEAGHLVGLRLPPGTGVVGHCIEYNEPMLVPDVSIDQRFYPGVDTQSGLTTRSLLCVPLETRGKVVGAIELVNKITGPFTEHDLELLASMSAFVSVAIENAQLYAALRDHAAVLEKEVTSRTRELQAILSSVADGLIVTDADDKVMVVNPAARRWLNLKEDPGFQGELAGILWHAIQGLARVSDGEQTAEIDIPLPPRQTGWQACYEWFHCTADCPVRQLAKESAACWLLPGTLCRQSHPQGFVGDSTQYCLSCEFYQRQEKITLQARSAQIHDEKDQAIGEVTVLRDITRLKELDRLKSQFVSNVSHELKTPLGSIKLYLSLLERGKPEKHERYMTVLHQEVNRLEGIITNLLDLSRLEMGTAKSDKEALVVNKVVEDALLSLRPRAGEKEVDLECTVPTDLPPALADGGQIHQVVTNLLSNAINYTPAGGRVQASTGLWHGHRENWQVSGDVPSPEQLNVDPPSGTWVVLCVTDTGKGIPADDLPRIFERFFRGQAERSEVPGTGLGLSIVKEIVDLHEGHIFVNSQLGEGSTFTVLLPAYHEPRRPLILVADDERDLHPMLEMFLQMADFDVDHAFNGQEALERIAAQPPDLLLLDLRMPVLDGYSVIQTLRASEATANLPILVLTSWTDDRGQEALRIGANEFLTKPLSGEVVVDVIRRLLELS